MAVVVMRRRRRNGTRRRTIVAAAPSVLVTAAGAVLWRRRAGRRGPRVEEVMTREPHTVTEETPVVEAARLMRDEDVGSLAVVTGDRVIGIVSDRDIAMRVVADGRDVQSVAVGEIMSRDPVLVRPEQELADALRLMARHQVRRLPVVENGGRLVGVLAQADVARAAGDEAAGETVERISEPTPEPRA